MQSSKSLCRAQSAITRSVQHLEAELGTKLFERHASGMMLTDSGDVLLARADRAYTEMAAARAAFEGDAGNKSWRRNALIFNLDIGQRRLRIFIELAEQQNMAAVARTLSISQPAISQTVRQIEEDVGVTLFRRSASGMAPTPLGAVLALHIKRALAEIRIAEDEIGDLNKMARGRVSVGSLSVGRARLLPRAIAQLLKEFPNLSVATEEGTYEHLAMRLRSGELDFILGALRPPSRTVGFDREIVAYDALAILVRTGHPLLKRDTISFSDVADLNWVLPQRATPTRESLEAAFEKRNMPAPTVKVETADLSVTFGTLVQSDLATAVSKYQVDNDIPNPSLCVVPFALPETRRPIGILQRSGGEPSRAARHLMQAIRDIGKQEG